MCRDGDDDADADDDEDDDADFSDCVLGDGGEGLTGFVDGANATEIQVKTCE